MSTIRDLVGTIRGLSSQLSTDSMLTDRLIASELKKTASLLIKREMNLRRLWATDTVFTTIPCLDLIEVPISECCEYVDDCTITRTKVKIPSIGEGIYQYAIQGVYTVDALGGKGKKLTEISINRYINLLNLPVIKKQDYYWISNGYLYTSNPNLKAIRLVAFFEEDVPNSFIYQDCSCGTSIDDDEFCKNPLDKKLNLPSYLEKQVLDLTRSTLLNTYHNIKQDVTTNGIDGTTPSKPTD